MSGHDGLSRRRLLALATGALTPALAGCQGSSGAPETDAPTSTPTETATETTAPEPLQTTTATERSTVPDPPRDAEPVVERTYDGSALDESPGSQFAPRDGFTGLSWPTETPVQVVRVNNRLPEGEGSLKWAVEHSGPRIVVFDVGGVVDLGGRTLTVENPECWIAGQTAPSPGVTLVRGTLSVEASRCLVQHLRSRPGDAGRSSGWEPDATRTGDDTGDVVFDHLTSTWGVDENQSVGYDTARTTFANSLMAEGLRYSTHSEGQHSAGTLVGDGASEVALLGNVYYANVQRNPLLKYETTTALVNNLVSHYGRDGTEASVKMLDTTTAAFVGNHFRDPADPADFVPTVDRAGEAYFEGNRSEAPGPLVDENITRLDERPLWPDGLGALPVGEVAAHNQSAVGARPADRTPHDVRILERVASGDGAFVDSQSNVGGYPDLESTYEPLSVPEGGIGDWLDGHTRAVELADAERP